MTAMAKWQELGLGGGYLTNEALGSRIIEDTVASIAPDNYNGQPQLVIELLNDPVKVALNIHSCTLLGKAWGDDWEGWRGRPVRISLQTVQVRGKPETIKVIEPGKPQAKPAKRK